MYLTDHILYPSLHSTLQGVCRKESLFVTQEHLETITIKLIQVAWQCHWIGHWPLTSGHARTLSLIKVYFAHHPPSLRGSWGLHTAQVASAKGARMCQGSWGITSSCEFLAKLKALCLQGRDFEGPVPNMEPSAMPNSSSVAHLALVLKGGEQSLNGFLMENQTLDRALNTQQVSSGAAGCYKG